MTMVGSEPRPASRLYLQLSQDHRVSRSFRATWFLRSLIQPFERQQEGVSLVSPASDDLSVLSSVGGDQVTPTTELIYICHRYSLVFVLDMGPSMMAVSNRTFKVKLDEAVSSLCACLQLLARPFQVPGNSVQLQLQLCVSVLTYCSTASEPIQVLLQGVHLQEGNREEITELLRQKIGDYETSLAQGCNGITCNVPSTEKDTASRGDSSLEGMVRAGTLGIQLLPRNALKGLILLTDGIPGFLDPTTFHATVGHMRSANISCWVVHVGGPPDPTTPLGLLPDIETLQFMASACNGCVLQPDKIMCALEGLDAGSLEPNAVQQAVLFWTFQRSARQWRIGGVVGGGDKVVEDLFEPIMHRDFQKNHITAPLLSVIGCRIREGFFVKDIAIRDSILEVYLYYPWQPSVTIYYTIIAPSPVSNASTHLQVTTSYDGPYSFVHDVHHCERNPSTTNTYRTSAVKKFRQLLESFKHSDSLMIHFLAFATQPSYHTLPQAILDGMPLFYLPPNQEKPEPSVGLSSSGDKDKKPKESSQIYFWRPFCSLKTKQWFHWFHTNKLILVLQQDSFLPRNLLTSSASGRYATLQCRLAASHLFAFLKTWSSFILLENHSFVRFLPLNEQPQYFCLIQVVQKPPCIMLHLAYVEGTPHSLQSQTFDSLCLSLRGLSMAKGERTPGHAHKRRSKTALTRKPCATVIDKQLNRVMIRYDNASVTQSLSADSDRLTQMQYLSCSKWQWDVPFPDPAITTALLRHRLKEGFNLTRAHNGIVTLTAQLTLEQPHSPTQLPMLLQYVVFPSASDTPSSELWVEPQYGTICKTHSNLRYLMGLRHEQISARVHAADRELVTAVATFLYLNHAPRGLLKTPGSCSVTFDLSSLLPKSRVLGFTMAAFSEVSSEERLDLASSSLMNREFREHLIHQLSSLAPTEVPLPPSHALLERLQSSENLEKLCHVCGITREDSGTRGWRCLSLGQEGSNVLFFLPPYFSRHDNGEGGAAPPDSPAAFVFPLILLHCSQELLIDPDPAHPDPPLLQPDIYQHLPLSNAEPVSLPTHLPPDVSKVVSELGTLHFSSYLHTIHSVLRRDLSIQPKDFIAAQDVCEKTVRSVDCTPLVAALCQHTVVRTHHGEGEGSTSPPPTDLLCQLHSAASSKLPSSCWLSPRGEEPTSSPAPWCEAWSGEIKETFQGYLAGLGFLKVPKCAGYYWLTSSPKEEEEDRSSEVSEEGPLPPMEGAEEGEGTPGASCPSSLASEQSTLRLKPSFSVDDDQLSQISAVASDRASNGSSGGEMSGLSPLLSPLLGLSSPKMPKPDAPSLPTAPLFLHVTCTVRSHGDQQEENVVKTLPGLPVCLKSVLSDSAPSDSDSAPSGSYTISLDLVFLAFSPKAQRTHTHETTPPTVMESPLLTLQTVLPSEHHSVAVSLQQKVEWLIADELISASCVATPISPTLLQAVATHVQTSPSQSNSCFSVQIPLKFVFGPTHSMSHFILQLEAMEVPKYSIVHIDEYYYLTPSPRPHSHTHNQEHIPGPELPFGEKPHPHTGRRSRTPPPILKAFKQISHRRAISCGYPLGHTPFLKSPASIPPSVQLSSRGSRTSLEEDGGVLGEGVMDGGVLGEGMRSAGVLGEGVRAAELRSGTVSTGYDADDSSLSTGVSEALPGGSPLDGTPPERGCGFWLVVRVLQHQTEVYFQLRSSQQGSGPLLEKCHSLCKHVESAVVQTCHRTNQWFLLKDMLETRNCSPLLLPESPQEAWVEKVVREHLPRSVTPTQQASFRPLEFQCDQKWRYHIAPHWRLKAMKMRAALQITRMALNAFAVSNRRDVYVLQDVKETGEETIFYLRIDESLCRVEDDGSRLEESIADGHTYDRSDTRATLEIDSLSSFSYQQSISELPESQFDRRGTTSSLELMEQQVGKPQESLVLELYGITMPSLDLLERLRYIIQQKLDDSALEIMCSLYARNQKLKLTPADIQFLQPPHNEATHVYNISLPSWIQEPQAFTFYYIQTLSTIALKPKYTSSSDTREKFQVPLELQNAYVITKISEDIYQDHLFLYIRPHTQGRGMAVICASLVAPSGRVIAPQPGIVEVTPGGCGRYDSEMSLEQATSCQIVEVAEEHQAMGGYSLRLHIWEKGNAGMADLSHKLAACYKHAVCDYLLELCLLPLPIARLDERFEVILPSPQSTGSPFIHLEMPSDSLYNSPVKRKLDAAEDAASRKTSLEQDHVFPGSGSRRASDESTSDTSAESSLRSGQLTHLSKREAERVFADIEEVSESMDAHSIQDRPQEWEGGPSPEHSLSWHQKEKIRREAEAQDALTREAHLGHCGTLEDSYHATIPNHLALTRELGSASVSRSSIVFVGSYSACVFLSQATAGIHQLCPDIELNAFTYEDGDSPRYVHCTPEKDLTKVPKPPLKVSKLRYIVIGRNPLQWEETLHPTAPSLRISQPWLDPQTKQSLQLFHPLDTMKPVRAGELPLQTVAANSSTFVPRQRLVLLIITNEKAELWLYNVSDELSTRLRNRLTQLGEWQQTRAGFLHHVLSQKMGLFQHTSGQDIQHYTKMASKHSSMIQDIVQLVKNIAPVSTETTPSRFSNRPPVGGQVAMETFYQETLPHGPSQNSADAVYNHGQQFRATYHHERTHIDARELLGKVFHSWQSRTGDSSAPVSTASISSLKQMARLLHYCTTPLLMQQALVPQAEGKVSAGTKAPGTWFDKICEEFLSFYIAYLKSLGFQPINERPSLQPSRQRGSGRTTPTRSHTPTPTSTPTHPPKLYKCLQHSWPGGIILIELSFQGDMFHVKLFTLESSRLVGETTINSEVLNMFSTECARYKDYIHVHSSMHDFHLRLLHSIVIMARTIPEHFDIRRFLELLHKQYRITPNFIRSRLCKDVIQMPVTIPPADLYHHIVAHCSVFDTQTLELRPSSPSSNPADICLFIHVSPKSLGPTTTPQLSKLLHDTQENYSIHIIAIYEPQAPDDRAKNLHMIFYLLLVNKRDSFPRLTCDSPHLSASRHPVPGSTPLGSPEGEGIEESAFHFNVRQHRRKLGFGSLSTPSAASQIVLSDSAIEEQMKGLQIHLENLVSRAQCHMRRDELWKRMLYGRPKSEGKPSSVHFEALTCTEFRELLQLVTVCPLETLDQCLAPLKKQTKKWFRKLLAPLEIKFAESIRIYCSEDDSYRFAAIINPEWQDMFVMVRLDRDGRHQGFSAVYRKPQEGGVPLEERKITAHVEAERQHIEAVVNFTCSFLWASILDTSPPQPHLSLL